MGLKPANREPTARLTTRLRAPHILGNLDDSDVNPLIKVRFAI